MKRSKVTGTTETNLLDSSGVSLELDDRLTRLLQVENPEMTHVHFRMSSITG